MGFANSSLSETSSCDTVRRMKIRWMGLSDMERDRCLAGLGGGADFTGLLLQDRVVGFLGETFSGPETNKFLM